MPDDGLYHRDFFAWTRAQAAALRQAGAARVNLPLDWDNLAEEIDSMGISDWRSLQSALALIIEHLLKLEYSPAALPRADWQITVIRERGRIADLLEESPSLEGRIDLAKAYRAGRRTAAASLTLHDGLDPDLLPRDCPYVLAELRDDAWWPANRHGLR